MENTGLSAATHKRTKNRGFEVEFEFIVQVDFEDHMQGHTEKELSFPDTAVVVVIETTRTRRARTLFINTSGTHIIHARTLLLLYEACLKDFGACAGVAFYE